MVPVCVTGDSDFTGLSGFARDPFGRLRLRLCSQATYRHIHSARGTDCGVALRGPATWTERPGDFYFGKGRNHVARSDRFQRFNAAQGTSPPEKIPATPGRLAIDTRTYDGLPGKKVVQCLGGKMAHFGQIGTHLTTSHPRCQTAGKYHPEASLLHGFLPFEETTNA
jgi:hypothetical protein